VPPHKNIKYICLQNIIYIFMRW